MKKTIAEGWESYRQRTMLLGASEETRYVFFSGATYLFYRIIDAFERNDAQVLEEIHAEIDAFRQEIKSSLDALPDSIRN